ncbi:MAG: CDP-alcohol phosphatidyltransferase family protein, partial [Chloroflexota bacterium]
GTWVAGETPGCMSSGAAAGRPLEAWTAALQADLRQGGYTPAAWARFLACSWRRARETTRREALLVRSWRCLSLTIAAGSAIPLAFAWRRYSPRQARRMGGILLVGLVLWQADGYVHLGLNRRLHDGTPLPVLGPAIWLSYLRGAVAYWLLAATATGIDIPGLAPGALAVGALTDALDGPLARRLRQATKLGAYVDGEADLVLAVALTLTAVRRGALPARAFLLVAARYALPVGAAFWVAFATGRPPALEHTFPGRLCGVAQTALMGYTLMPKRKKGLDKPRQLLLGLAAALSVASGAAQVARVVWPRHGRPWQSMPAVMAPSPGPAVSIALVEPTRERLQRSSRSEHA